MSIDWDSFKFWMTILALVSFNGPIVFTAWRCRNIKDLSGALREKNATDPNPNPQPDPVSFSRVTGMIGAVVVASLFWIMSNVAIGTAILDPGNLTNMLTGITKLFFVGTALFVPYAFNQIKTLLQ